MTVGVTQAHDETAAGIAQRFDRHTFRRREAFEVGQAGEPQAQGDEAGVAELRRVHEGRRALAAHEQHTLRTGDLGQAEVDQEGAHRVQVGRGEANVGDVLDFDRAHVASSYLTI